MHGGYWHHGKRVALGKGPKSICTLSGSIIILVRQGIALNLLVCLCVWCYLSLLGSTGRDTLY